MSGKNLDWVDELAQTIRSDVSIYQFVSPQNEDIERRRFEQEIREQLVPVEDDEVIEATQEVSLDEIRAEDLRNIDLPEPDFAYADGADYSSQIASLEEAREVVSRAEASETVKNVYLSTLDELEALIDIVENVGDRETVQQASQIIYGSPSEEALNWAEDTLESLDSETDEKKEFSAEDMRRSVEGALEEVGMSDWKVNYTQKGVVSVNGASREIRVPENRKYGENEILRLVIHEIGTHALRSANGYLHEFEILGSGAAEYHPTGEGLALFMEEATGLSDNNLKRKYAARALAAESLLQGDDFGETYTLMREKGLNHDQAWSISTRAHRAGGFVKDHIYAEGLQQVTQYAEKEGTIDDLLIGKISEKYAGELSDSELDSEYNPVDIARSLERHAPEGVDPSSINLEGLREYVES